jgi:endonuclease/exonuclease/phosphatase family metal-dependent hydrolase
VRGANVSLASWLGLIRHFPMRVTKRRLWRFIIIAVLGLPVSLGMNWLLLPWKVVRLFGSGDSPPPSSQLTIASWNLCHARGGNSLPWPVLDSVKRDARLAEMARVLAEAKPDIVVLNECAFASTGIGGPNQAGYLAQKLGLPWRVEQRNGDVWALVAGHQWGNAVLSRHPIVSAEFVALPQLDTWSAALGLKRKNAVVCRISLGDGRTIRVLATHLPIGPGSDALRLEAVKIMDRQRATSTEPLFLAGDFNVTMDSPPVAWLLSTGYWHTHAEGLTFPASQPRKKIDWIFAPTPWPITDQWVPTTSVSDHLPVITSLTTQLPSRQMADR